MKLQSINETYRDVEEEEEEKSLPRRKKLRRQKKFILFSSFQTQAASFFVMWTRDSSRLLFNMIVAKP